MASLDDHEEPREPPKPGCRNPWLASSHLTSESLVCKNMKVGPSRTQPFFSNFMFLEGQGAGGQGGRGV